MRAGRERPAHGAASPPPPTLQRPQAGGVISCQHLEKGVPTAIQIASCSPKTPRFGNAGRAPPGQPARRPPASPLPHACLLPGGVGFQVQKVYPQVGTRPGPKLRGQDKHSGSKNTFLRSLSGQIPSAPWGVPPQRPQTEPLQKGQEPVARAKVVSGARQPMYKAPPRHVLAVWPWASYFTSLLEKTQDAQLSLNFR